MPIGLIILALIVQFAFAGKALADCSLVTGGTAPKNYDMISECDAIIPSHVKSLYLQFKGGSYFLHIGTSVDKIGDYGTPSNMSWNSKGSDFYINDGEGSELSSKIHLFVVRKGKSRELTGFRDDIERRFKNVEQCDRLAESPNTWGIGWSANGHFVYILTQSAVDPTCGGPDRYYVSVVDIRDGKLLHLYPSSIARKHYSEYLPENLR